MSNRIIIIDAELHACYTVARVYHPKHVTLTCIIGISGSRDRLSLSLALTSIETQSDCRKAINPSVFFWHIAGRLRREMV